MNSAVSLYVYYNLEDYNVLLLEKKPTAFKNEMKQRRNAECGEYACKLQQTGMLYEGVSTT